jgi:hypothetical protein
VRAGRDARASSAAGRRRNTPRPLSRDFYCGATLWLSLAADTASALHGLGGSWPRTFSLNGSLLHAAGFSASRERGVP